jgi:geranylgeranyl diphosphate synthase type I
MGRQALARAFLPAIEAEMRAVLDGAGGLPTGELYAGMLRYHLGWSDEQLRPAAFDPGKRVRPTLVLLCCLGSGLPWETALPAAAAVELVHNFSLIHDDIQDDSPLRRGRRTVWQLWGRAQAINAGDAMFTLAHLALQRLSARGVRAALIVAALGALDEACLRLTQGQYLDMDFEQRAAVGVDEYLTMIGGKTAALTACAAQLGALAADAPPERVEQYYRYGLNLGLAFQILDDVLGIWGDSQVTGKSAATDVASRKKSLPVLYALERDAELAARYARHAAGPAAGESIDEIVARIAATGAREYALARAEEYSERAVGHLRAAQPVGEAAPALEELTAWLLQRSY